MTSHSSGVTVMTPLVRPGVTRLLQRALPCDQDRCVVFVYRYHVAAAPTSKAVHLRPLLRHTYDASSRSLSAICSLLTEKMLLQSSLLARGRVHHHAR